MDRTAGRCCAQQPMPCHSDGELQPYESFASGRSTNLTLREKIRRQLLQFRLRNYKTLTLPKISGEEKLQPRTRDLFRAFALPLGEHEEVCGVLLGILKRQESLREVLSVQQSAVLDVLHNTIHSYPELNTCRIVELTESVNATLRQRGEPGRLSEKKVSDILTSLHLTNRTRKNCGYVLWLDRRTREEIHSLARTHGVNAGTTLEMSARCELCRNTSDGGTGGSTTEPLEESARVKAKGPREHRAHGERRKWRVRRKPSRKRL